MNLIINGNLYDVKSYLHIHPGGQLPILNLIDTDVSDAFDNFHPPYVRKHILPKYRVAGVNTSTEATSTLTDYRRLKRHLKSIGLFKSTRLFYLKQVVKLSLIFTLSITATLLGHSVALRCIGAALLGMFWQQLAFVGHDIGHNSVFKNRARGLWWGILIGNSLGGISLGWWKHSHNVHHVVTNSIENDPDIQHLPAFAVDEKLLHNYQSSFHRKHMRVNALSRFLVSYQHILFYPVMLVARFNLYIQGVLHLINHTPKYKALEIKCLLFFCTWNALLLTRIESNRQRLVFIVISHAVTAILHVQISISHFAEEIYNGVKYSGDWVGTQCNTTANVKCSPSMDWVHGGLQFQIEHHLFPRLPREHLRRASLLVKPFCHKHKLKYVELNFLNCNLRVLQKMKNTAYQARKLPNHNRGVLNSLLYSGMNLQ